MGIKRNDGPPQLNAATQDAYDDDIPDLVPHTSPRQLRRIVLLGPDFELFYGQLLRTFIYHIPTDHTNIYVDLDMDSILASVARLRIHTMNINGLPQIQWSGHTQGHSQSPQLFIAMEARTGYTFPEDTVLSGPSLDESATPTNVEGDLQQALDIVEGTLHATGGAIRQDKTTIMHTQTHGDTTATPEE
jgi:hypothetical protein